MNPRGNGGYSLLELLVALALMAVIAIMMVQATNQLHPLRPMQARYDEQAIADRLTEVMAQDLKAALALPLSVSESRVPMIGTRDRIRFVALLRTGFATVGL
jgi:prepilin-type N-terminal cleavage/methylation domain-containing protein